MRLAPLDGFVGRPLDFSASEPIQNALSSANTDLSSFSRFQLGASLMAVPSDPPNFTANVPNWVASELMMVRYVGSTALVPGTLVHIDKDATISAVPTTANTGRPVFVALTNFSAGNVVPQVGWVMRSGIAPVLYASAAAGVLGISSATAGNAAANSAGRQLLNATCLLAATSSFTRAAGTRNGSPWIDVPSAAGMFIGQAVSGVSAAGTIAAIAPDGLSVRLSANQTATARVTATFTATGFGIVHFDRPFVQGAIT